MGKKKAELLVNIKVEDKQAEDAIKAEKSFKNTLGGIFMGDEDVLVAILDPHVANWLVRKTKPLKKKIKVEGKYICSNTKCVHEKDKEIMHLESAHPLNKERPLIIKEAIKELYPNKSKEYDIAKVLAKVKDTHESLHFAFLCRPCHNMHSMISADQINSKTFKEWAEVGKAAKKANGE